MNEVNAPKKKRKLPITLKLLIIMGIVLALLIPKVLIMQLIRERENRQQEVVNEISSKWGGRQVIIGPIVTVPFKERYLVDDYGKKKYAYRTTDAHFLPEELNITGTIIPEKKHRGIYDIVVYKAKLKVTGKFKKPDFTELGVKDDEIYWNSAVVSVGIPDLKGLNEYISLTWNDEVKQLNTGLTTTDNFNSGMHAPIIFTEKDTYSFSFDIDLNGTEMLSFVPVGKETSVTLNSPWTTPSFDGAYITQSNTIDANGFTANWKVLEINRNFGQKWTGNKYNPEYSYNENDELEDFSFGVKLIVPVDHYQKNERSVKYAILFIALTFVVFFFAEIMNKRPIHPVQYTLVGAALCIFYTLLISFSEHISFNLSYLIAAVAVISMITLYARSAFKSTKVSLIVAGVLIALYVYLFTILQLIDYSLLFGNIGLFIVLAVIMFFSKKINWYNNEENE
ncbi:MAG: cell envelope integrity protein CreD [Bacteroidales bacterium]|nr:cell envelope integrity protein CreD [Bacteroidales bacterium]